MIDAGLLDPLAQGSRALELTGDAAFLAAMVRVELALSRALVDTGVAPEWMLEVCDGLETAEPDVVAIASASRAGGNPVIPLVTWLGAAADALHHGASDHVHLGATSQDILDTAAMLVARAVCDEVLARLKEAGASLASLVETHRATPMVARTLGQHAAPTTFGFVAAGWLDGVTTAIDGLHRVRGGLPVQLGGAVGSLAALSRAATARGSSADEVAAAVARRLGLRLAPISWHTNRAPVLDVAAALAAAVAAVGVVAVDVAVLARTEIGELVEGGGGGSSAMPHKRNPITAVLVTAAARRTPHELAALHASALSEDQRPTGAWHAEWLPLRELERSAVSAAHGAATLIAGLEVNVARMAANLALTGGLIFSERVSAVLAETVGGAAAFALVGEASREAVVSGRPLSEVVAEAIAAGPYDRGARDAVAAAFAGDSDSDSDTAAADAAIDRVLAAYRAVTVGAPTGEAS
ncbi:3-carboxy-cis,cis-muconate cycloisomerase [Conyzicola nivalis]|uniref:3-carboxy-cis,cis-muconate cycloisomerase n=1 Tax=Conyzicola nivalis TaxID=1477021 RepID=A0A916SI38_9MICO|nr:lyase family protein [Conyzicola nivalis]GGB01691.1 3-carboxy-cis,cis-muconate cycloisomerase [Conyzicola nivalis]